MESIGDPWKRGDLGPLRSQMRHNIPSEMKPRGIEKAPAAQGVDQGQGFRELRGSKGLALVWIDCAKTSGPPLGRGLTGG